MLRIVVLDTLAWLAAAYLATALRLEDFQPVWSVSIGGGGVPVGAVVAAGALAAVAHVGLASALRLYQGRVTFAGFEEFIGLSAVTLLAGMVTTVVAFTPFLNVPRSVPTIAGFIALVLCVGSRGILRMFAEARVQRDGDPDRVVVIGAGDGGRQLVDSMQRDPDHHWDPVCFLDDDVRKRHFRHRGVRVEGTIDDLATVAADLGASVAVLAIPTGESELFTRVNSACLDAGITLKVLPGVGQLLDGASYRQVRDLEPEDLLGRHPVTTDLAAIGELLAGKRVLVTGAGGSIGSELCRQVWRFNPDRLVMLDRDESALHSLHLSLHGRADLESEDTVLCDIRDADRVMDILQDVRPHVVFHAAALKHVNMLEHHAVEGLRTNVWGTLSVLEAAADVGVERFINISTDKAADPCNVLGYTKRIAELVTSAVGRTASGTYQSVRFGNVLGTNGSVLKTFASQIERGGPVTVTDPDVTRYFMTVDEAVQLVLQAAAIGRSGEALVLDMGEPIAILDVARRLIAQSGRDIGIVYTGLKTGEKLHEDLFATDEKDERPLHPLVSHVAVPAADLDQVRALPTRGRNDVIRHALRSHLRLDHPRQALVP
ncbi:polysaccharide biosynthesis protein [Aeromicrobium sp.]|uniref:polysaccharide biosynthesis protein n=1 Tax=Aeromicrobium sp. TaxID=1871063 RepID=UPI0040348C25